MLGSLAALAALATVGEVSYQIVSAHFASGNEIINFSVCPVVIEYTTQQCSVRGRDGTADFVMGKHLGGKKSA